MIRNLNALLGENFASHKYDNRQKLWDRAAHQWNVFVGGAILAGVDGLVLAGLVHMHESKAILIGAAVIEIGGLVTAGVGLGGLNETGRTYNQRLEAQQAASLNTV